MKEDVFNMSVRKFLKQVGVTSQREMERAVREAIEKSEIDGRQPLRVRVTLELEDVGLTHIVEDDIRLE